MSIPVVDIVTVTYGNMFPVLKRTVDSLYRFTKGPFRLIIVNNGSTDETLTAFNGLAGCTLINLQENVGTLRALNIGLRHTTAPLIARMDHDVEFVMPWEDGLLGALTGNRAADAAGPRLLTPDGRIYAALFHFFFKVPRLPVRFAVDNPFSLPRPILSFIHYSQHSLEADSDALFGRRTFVYHVPGTFLVFKRDAFEKVGFPDESYPDMNGAYEDLDYTLRFIMNGFKVIYEGGTKVIHHCSRPLERFCIQEPLRNKMMFKKKWGFL